MSGMLALKLVFAPIAEGWPVLREGHRNRRPPRIARRGAGGAGRRLRHRLRLRGAGAALSPAGSRGPGGDRALAVGAGPAVDHPRAVTRSRSARHSCRLCRSGVETGARRSAAFGLLGAWRLKPMTASPVLKRRWKSQAGCSCWREAQCLKLGTVSSGEGRAFTKSSLVSQWSARWWSFGYLSAGKTSGTRSFM